MNSEEIKNKILANLKKNQPIELNKLLAKSEISENLFFEAKKEVRELILDGHIYLLANRNLVKAV